MKKLLLATIFSVLPYSAFAQDDETLYFYPKQACIDVVYAFQNAEEYDEKLLFTGTGIQYDINGTPYSAAMFFFVNQESGTWVLMNTYEDGSTCLVNLGFGFTPYTGQQPGE